MWKHYSIILLAVLQIILVNGDDAIEEIVVERIDFPMGNDSKIFRNIDLRVRKYNRTLSVLHGSVEFLMPITNDLKYLLDVYYHVSGNQYHLLFSREQDNVCTAITTNVFSSVLESLYENAGILNEFKKCPKNLGKVTLINYHANKDLAEPFLGPISIKEKWKATLTVMNKSSEVLDKFDIYVRVRSQFSD